MYVDISFLHLQAEMIPPPHTYLSFWFLLGPEFPSIIGHVSCSVSYVPDPCFSFLFFHPPNAPPQEMPLGH